MSTYINIDDNIRVNVVFYDWEIGGGGDGDPVDPLEVEVQVLDSTGTELASHLFSLEPTVVVNTEVGAYYYDWAPPSVGSFKINFIGTFPAGVTSIVSENFEVGGTSASTVILGEDHELLFMANLEPLYVDPEEFLGYYEEAGQAEIVELVHRYSTQVKTLLGDKEPTFTAIEYIRNATLCALGRIYDYGLSGDGGSISLGDLKISSQTYPRNKINKTNAANPCELSAVLWQELIRSESGMKEVVKGTRYTNPMPKRHIRHGGRRFSD